MPPNRCFHNFRRFDLSPRTRPTYGALAYAESFSEAMGKLPDTGGKMLHLSDHVC